MLYNMCVQLHVLNLSTFTFTSTAVTHPPDLITSRRRFLIASFFKGPQVRKLERTGINGTGPGLEMRVNFPNVDTNSSNIFRGSNDPLLCPKL